MSNSFALTNLNTLKGLVIERLGLKSDEKELLKALVDNEAVTQTAVYDLVDLSFAQQTAIDTDVDELELTLTPSAALGFQLGLYAPGADLQLADVMVPAFQSSSMTYDVPDDRIACGMELTGSLGLKAAGNGNVQGWKLGLTGQAELELVLRFFKTLESNVKAQDAVVETARSLKSFFHVTSAPPQKGEIIVTDFRGMLKLGASLDYGWSVSGTKKTTPGMDVELASDVNVEAKLGLAADFRLDSEFAVIVQPDETRADWVNASVLKKRESEVGLAANLNVEATLATKIGFSGKKKTDVGPFVDSLLNRTALPDLIGKLKRFDTAEEQTAELQQLTGELVDQITGEIEQVLERPVARLEEILAPVKERVEELIAAYREIDSEVAAFLTDALDKFEEKTGIDEAMAQIDGLEKPADLLDLLAKGNHDAARVRDALEVLSKLFDADLSQVGLIESSFFPRIKGLAAKYREQRSLILKRYADAYGWLKKQLRIDEAVDRIEAFLDGKLDLQALLDEQILWLNEYLGQELDKPIAQIVGAVAPATEVLAKITKGYDTLVGKAKNALKNALNHELSFQANLAWNRIRSNQALASVDLNLAEAAGRGAMKQLMVGDLAEVMRMRLTNAHAVRFRRSHFLDELRRSISVKTVVNGRENLRVKSYIVRTTSVLEPTENGEIWAATTQGGETFKRSNRRAMIDVGTMFTISSAEHFLRNGRRLESQGTKIRDRSIDYSYREKLAAESVSGQEVVDRLIEIRHDLELDPVPRQSFNSLLDQVHDVGARGALREVAIEIDYSIDGDALQHVFQGKTPAQVESHFQGAWDKAAVDVFGDLKRAMAFYHARTNGNGWDLAELRSPSAGLNLKEQFVAQALLHKRETVPGLMKKLQKDVFLNFHQDRLEKILKKVGKNMNWMNGLEFEPTRNFMMSVFAYAVDPTERGGSIVVRYKHPTSQEPMQMRVDAPTIAADA